MPSARLLVLACLCAALAACGRDEGAAPDAGAPLDAAPTDTTATAPAPESSAPPPVEPAPEPEPPPKPEWEPALDPPAADAIAAMLQRADAAFAEGRIERGADNALDLYLSVLESDPANAEAQAGVGRIVVVLFERIDAALAERRYVDAAEPMSVLRKLRPDDAATAERGRRVEVGFELLALLARAERLAAAGQAIEPSGDNAAEVYAEVLRRDAEEPAALAGLMRLETELVAQATAAAEAGDYARSDRLLADAARVRPGSGNVQNASTRIVEMRQDRAGQLLQQAYDAAATGEVARAEQLLRQLEQVSAQSQGIEELRQRIEQARLYGGFAPGQSVTDALSSGGSAPQMVVVPAGKFEMGSPVDEPQRRKNEGPRHEVVLARGFAIAAAEISVAQFRDFVQSSGYVSSAERARRSTIYDERTGTMAERRGIDWRMDHAGRAAAPQLPVVHVSWSDAKAYADWLTRETGETYRLPSEAEFEYVQRAGSTSRYRWGDGPPRRPLANLTGERDRSASNRVWGDAFPDYGDGFWGAAPVRSFEPTAHGLHDVDGNVSEWVEDCWHDNYSRAPSDGSAWVNPGCSRRIIRGASWASAPDQARSAFRISAVPEATNARVGFRVVREL